MLFKLAGIWLEGFGEPARLGIAGLGAIAISLAGTRNALPEPLDKLAPALLLVMTLDFVFGVIVAIIGRKFCWPGLLKGLVNLRSSQTLCFEQQLAEEVPDTGGQSD